MRCFYVSLELLKKKIKFEISEIEKELDNFEPLISSTKQKTPDLIEITAILSVLHAFYNGIENNIR